jgi:hypothetical protein
VKQEEWIMSVTMRIAAVLAAGSFAVSAAAAPKDVVVPFSGCTMPGVEAGCLLVKNGKRIYNISSAKPRPNLYRTIAGHGVVSNGVTTCMQGTALSDVRWHYIRLVVPCPKGPKAARRPG